MEEFFFLFILIFEVNYGAMMEMPLKLQLLSCFFIGFLLNSYSFGCKLL